MRISPTTLALLLVAVAAIGLVAGRMVAADDPGGEATLASPQATLDDEPILPLTLPVEDSAGTDLPSLPRYPGSIRTEWHEDVRAETREVDLEYLIRGSIDEVRTFYRGVFSRHDWQVIDVELAYGELRYILTDGTRDGVVELESRAGGVVEIDLHLLEPLASTSAPLPEPQPAAPGPQAPAPQAPAPPTTWDDVDWDYDD